MRNLVFILLMLVTGCGLFSVEPTEVYIIEEGLHNSNHPLATVCKRDISFKVNWNDHHIYDLGNENQGDINKLFGITSASVHKNSARIGWRAEGDSIGLFAYWYINGERGWERLGTTHPRTLDKFRVSVKGGKYLFEYTSMDKSKHKVVTVNGVDKKFFINSYYSYPWFGGNEYAPHRMIFKIYML